MPVGIILVFYIMKKTLLLLFGALLLLNACQEPVSPVNMFITRADDYGTSVSHSMYIMFHIKAFSESDEITRIECQTFESENGVQPVFDTLFASGTTKVEYDYAYFTQYYTTSENMRVKMTFTAYTKGGESLNQVVYFYVTGNVLLVPYENLIMYSGAQTAKANGLSLEWVTPIIMQTTDSTRVDLFDYHEPGSDPNTLSREWRSLTGLSFVRYNDFNFPAATVQYLQNAYLAGNKYSSISNLQYGDIVLVGRGNSAIGVFQIQSIYDEEGVENDRYELTFKKK